jgi:DNA-binding transcriptional MerR regulator
VPDDERYSLTELADLAGVTPRTVRFYLAQGLLPAVGQSGPGSKYDPDHLARLRLIRRLQAEHLPLAEIRRRLDDLEPEEIRDLAGDPIPPPPPDSALEYLRAVLAAPAPARLRPTRRVVLAGVAEPASVTYGAPPAEPPIAGAPIERSQWERIVLAPDVELHLRRPLSRAQNKQVDRLVTIARELLEEDRP